MKKLLCIMILIFISISISSAEGNLYVKTFGVSNDKPIIFLHGGPGYNSANFEAITAQKLANSGFYVLVYDRKGEGRSKDKNAKYTFEETFDDLLKIYNTYGFSKATLIGHSFGGIIATLFAEKFPDKVQSIILVGAPLSLQKTFKTIITKTKNIYKSKNDSINLQYISILENMDKKSLQYSSYSFLHAMQNGFYSPSNPTEEAKKIYLKFSSDSLLVKYASQMDYEAPQGFWKNEQYTTIDLSENLKNLFNLKINIYGLYGKDDGLFDTEQIDDIKTLIGNNNLMYIERCSHNVFIDQQELFISQIETWIK